MLKLVKLLMLKMRSIHIFFFLFIVLAAIGFVAPQFNQVLAGSPPNVNFLSYDGDQSFGVGYSGGENTSGAPFEVFVVLIDDGNYVQHIRNILGNYKMFAFKPSLAVGYGQYKLRFLFCKNNVSSCNITNNQMSGTDDLPAEFDEVKIATFTYGTRECIGSGCFSVGRSGTFVSGSGTLVTEVTNADAGTGC